MKQRIFDKTNWRHHRTHDADVSIPEGWTAEKPIYKERFQKWDETLNGWVKDETAYSRAAAETEAAAIKAEIAARDYRALKAMKLGQPLDSLYPGESAWYAENLARLQELEAEIAASAAAV